MRRPIPKRISQILPTFQNVAQTSHYSVQFSLPNSSLKSHLRAKGVDTRFTLEKIGLLCAGASLPGSSLANVPVQGDHQGVIEQMAHTRIFTQMSLDFYIDNEYKTLKFLEHWMEYVGDGGSQFPGDDNYFFRMRYPKDYKSDETRIIKFEKNYRQYMEYKFIGLFPINLSSTRVQYENSNVLKATCSFSYDRYIAGGTTSLERDKGTDLNQGRDVYSKDAAWRTENSPLQDRKKSNFYTKNDKKPLSFKDAVSLGNINITDSIQLKATENIFGDPPANGDVISTYFK